MEFMAQDLGSVTVWKVELNAGTPPTDTRGELSIEKDALVFQAHGTASRTAIPFADAQQAKRLRMSPVLLLRWRESAEDRQTAFYFVQPPPLDPPEEHISVTPPGPFDMFRRPSRRRQRRQNASFLSVNASQLRPTILTWAEEVQRRIAEAQKAS
jgi:hypothetical protein